MPVFPLAKAPDAKGRFALSPKDGRHLHRVLRVGLGESFSIRLPDGRIGTAELLRSGAGFAGRVLELQAAPVSEALPVWLGLSWVRLSRLEWAVEKATELGVSRLTFLKAAHSQHAPTEREAPKKMERLARIAGETLKQCERPAAPRFDTPQSLADFLLAVNREKAAPLAKVFFRERRGATRFSAANLASLNPALWVILVGPEGGWSEAEVKALLEHGFQDYTLGSSIYRTETAAIYALSTVDFLRGR